MSAIPLKQFTLEFVIYFSVLILSLEDPAVWYSNHQSLVEKLLMVKLTKLNGFVISSFIFQA